MIKITLKPQSEKRSTKLQLLLIYAFMLLPFARMIIPEYKIRKLKYGKFQYDVMLHNGENPEYSPSCFEFWGRGEEKLSRLEATSRALNYHEYNKIILTFSNK